MGSILHDYLRRQQQLVFPAKFFVVLNHQVIGVLQPIQPGFAVVLPILRQRAPLPLTPRSRHHSNT